MTLLKEAYLQLVFVVFAGRAEGVEGAEVGVEAGVVGVGQGHRGSLEAPQLNQRNPWYGTQTPD